MKNILVPLEEMLKNLDMPTSDEKTQVTLLKKIFDVNTLKCI
jgi:hypothetical protein